MMIKYTTTFEATRNAIETIELGHGENADLHAAVTDEGVPVELTGYAVQAIYQPESLWGTDTFYSCPAEIAGNEAVVHWSHAQDTGEKAVKMWVRLEKDGKVSYPAMYAMALFPTPGFTPGTVDPIPPVIDFSEYTLLNAPWLAMQDGDSGITWQNGGLNVTVANGMVVSADYVDLSVTGNSMRVDCGTIELAQGFGSLFDGEGDNLLHVLDGKESTSNKTTAITAAATNAQYPSAKAVADYVGGVVGDINSVLDAINGEVI